MLCIKCHQEVPDGPFCCQCGASQTPSKRKRKRGNGQGSVYKRGNTWTASVTVGGYSTLDGKYRQLKNSKGGFRTRTEAINYIPILQKGKEKKSTFASLLKTYYAGAYNKLSRSKQNAYDIAANRWKAIMHLKVQDASLGQLQEVLNREASTYYPARDMQSVLSHLYKIAMAEQTATVNLARLLTLPELVEESPEPFSEIELHKLWDAYADGDHFYGFILLMIYSGMMPGELLNLTVDMIDLDAMEIRGCGLKTKKRKEVAIVFPYFLCPVVTDLCAHANKRGKIVGLNKDKFYNLYHDALQRAGVRDLPPYSCRHTTATALALDNIAPSIIQEVMRHSKITTTQRYIHTSSKDAHEAINSMPQKNA